MNAARRAEAMVALDAAMERVARAHFRSCAEPVAVDVHVVFLARCDGTLTASAQVSGGGRSVCFCAAEASNAGGRVVARALAAFRPASDAAGSCAGLTPFRRNPQ